MKEDFFSSKRIKKLRKMAGGDTYTIIYLKMQLLSLKTDGILTWTGLEENFASELALDLDETPEDVQVVLMYLQSCGLLETSDNTNFFLPYVAENTGSENASAQRVREFRARQALQSNTDETQVKRLGNVEKENRVRDKSKSKELEKDSVGETPTPTRFTPPTVQEVQAYCAEKGYRVDAERFVDYYTSNGWMVGRNHMKDWRAAVRTWVRKDGKEERKTNNIFLQILEDENGQDTDSFNPFGS